MMADPFNTIYQTKAWGEGSGKGSLREGLVPYKVFLSRVIKEHNIKSIVDFGCGYFEPYSDMDWHGIDYAGIDIAHDCYVANQQFIHGGRVFREGDWLSLPDLPKADLAICKDVLQHWTEVDILSGLTVLKQYPLMLITNSLVNGPAIVNGDIPTGDFRPLNLLQPPYSLVPLDMDAYRVKTNEQDVKLMLLCRNH